MSRPSAYLLVVPATGDAFSTPIEQDKCIIGSSRSANVRIADPELAATHATIHFRDSGYLIERDATPFQVNGLKVRQHVLQPFDLITLGRTACSFRLGQAPSRSTADQANPVLDLARKLNSFTSLLDAGVPTSDLARHLVGDVAELTKADHVSVVQWEDDAPSLATPLHAEHGTFSEDDSAFSQTVLARVRQEGAPILVADTRLDPTLASAASILRSKAISVMCAPIRHNDKVVGALYVSGTQHPFKPDDLELVALYAHQAFHLLASANRERGLREKLEEAKGKVANRSLLIGSSPAMQAVRHQVERIAGHAIPVLLLGETGTGKEVVAREIHRLSTRSEQPFVAVDCASIPEPLFQSEMFGHTRGAFTHAHQSRKGKIRAADGGTLFLDEIGELPPAQQAMLLRVLQDQIVTPVGEERSYSVDFRLVCATNRPLDKEVEEGRFRHDLFFRLNSVTITLPPLRQRADDITELARFFLANQFGTEQPPRLSSDALVALRQHDWEGNVRQLEAAVRRAAVLCENGVVHAVDLGLASPPPPPASDSIQPLALARDEFLKHYVRSVVDRCQGNRGEAADKLMVSVRTVFRYMEEL